MKNQGKVKWYDEFKGFGFIESEEGEDIFVHRSGIIAKRNILQADQHVVFEKQQGKKGPVAVNVEVVE